MTEQEWQDDYCRTHNLPILRQQARGIDYYHESVGYKEFIRRGVCDLKDILIYPEQTNGEPYSIVFVECPRKKSLKLFSIVSKYATRYT